MLKLLAVLLIFAVTLLSGFYPFFKKHRSHRALDFPRAESLAAGVFLGAALMHMLADASHDFHLLNVEYPLAFCLAGATFLALLWLEHVGRELYQHRGASSPAFALLSVFMLSLHSFLTGTALGVSTDAPMTLMLVLAILGHKWAASFSLAVHINQSSLGFRARLSLFLFFAAMVPLGVWSGASAVHAFAATPWLVPVFTSLAAGTFLYLGSLHGLDRSVLVKPCCNLGVFSFVLLGFTVMAVAAWWL